MSKTTNQYEEEPPVNKPPENSETLPSLQLEISGPCKTPGEKIGLTQAQRDALQIENHGYAIVKNDQGNIIGFFTVVIGKKENVRTNRCTINLPADFQGKITVEKIQAIESLNLEVAGSCYTKGRYIGLSLKQRNLLRIDVGETVHLKTEEQDLGKFVVVKGKKELIESSLKFTANLPEGTPTERIIVTACKTTQNI